MLARVEKPKKGRPSKYNEKLADRICSEIAKGRSLATVCEIVRIDPTCVYEWLSKHPDFPPKYAKAKQDQLNHYAEEIIAIADKADVRDPAAVNKARLQVDSRKWIMSKVAPKKWGDKLQQEISGPNGAAIMIERVYFSEPPVKTIESTAKEIDEESQ